MDLGENLLPITLSLGAGLYSFYFGFVCGKSTVLLLLIVIGNASYASSLGRIKSQIPCNSTTSSSLVCSSTFEIFSSSIYDLAFDIMLRGFRSEEGFLL